MRYRVLLAARVASFLGGDDLQPQTSAFPVWMAMRVKNGVFRRLTVGFQALGTLLHQTCV